MPKNLNQEEAVQYFRQWIVDNMKYDESLGESASSNEIIRYAAALTSTKKACIINKFGICSGFSSVLADLCQRVGIDAYVEIGSASDGYNRGMHAWLTVRIGEQIFYADPTKDVGIGKVTPLQTREQLQGQNIKYTFIKHFDY